MTFFSDAHPVSLDNPGAGTYSNLYSSATTGARGLSPGNFAYLRAQLQSRRLENGLPMPLGKLTLTVPVALRTTAEQILNLGMFAPGTAYGAIGTYLTSDTRWYLSSELGGLKPFIYQERQPVKFTPMVSPTDANVFDLNVLRYGADVRNNAGYYLPQLCVAADV